MPFALPTGVRLGGYLLQAHQTHQALDSFTVYSNTFAVQVSRHLAATIKRMSQKLFIDKPHEFQILRTFGKRQSGSVV